MPDAQGGAPPATDSKGWMFFTLALVALLLVFPLAVATALFAGLNSRISRREWVILAVAGVVAAVRGSSLMIESYFHWLGALGFGGDRGNIPWLSIIVYGVVFGSLAGLAMGTQVGDKIPGLFKGKRLDTKTNILPTEAAKSKLSVAQPPMVGSNNVNQGAGRKAQTLPPNSFALGVGADGKPVYITTEQIGMHALLFGSTGSGKSVTIQVIAGGLLDLGWSGIVLDLKEDTKPGGLRDWCKDYAGAHAVPYQELRLSDPNPTFWFNPLAGLGQDEVRDTILSLTKFDDEYYQSVSKLVLGQLLKLLWWAHEIDPVANPNPTMADIANILSSPSIVAATKKERALIKSHMPDLDMDSEFRSLLAPNKDQANQAASWGAKLGQLYTTQAGLTLLRPGADGSRPVMDVTQHGVTYIGLDSTSKLDLSKVVSAAVLQRISVDAAQRTTGQSAKAITPRFIIVDEASIVDRDIVQALLSKARSAGVAMVLATQGPKDWMDRGADDYAKLGQNTNVAIIMSQGEPEAAELCADYIGKEEYMAATYSHRDGEAMSAGSIRQERDYLVSPDDLRRLKIGEAVIRVGKPAEQISWVKVIPRDAAAGGPAPPQPVSGPGPAVGGWGATPAPVPPPASQPPGWGTAMPTPATPVEGGTEQTPGGWQQGTGLARPPS